MTPTWSRSGDMLTQANAAGVSVTLDAYSPNDATLTIHGAAKPQGWVFIGLDLMRVAAGSTATQRWFNADVGMFYPADLNLFNIEECRRGCVVSLHFGEPQVRCTHSGGGKMGVECKAQVADTELRQVGALLYRLGLIAIQDTGGTFSDIRGNLIRLGGVEL